MTLVHQPMRIVGILSAVVIFGGLAGCGGNGTTTPPSRVLDSITLASNGNVAAGATIQGTASLNGAAAAGGANVTLSSSNANVATVPGNVLIPEGSPSANFTVTGVSGGTATITGNFGGARTANVSVTATLDLVSVTLASSSVTGTGTVQGTVTLSIAAPAGGTTVGLSSSNAGAASVPGNVTVNQGSTTADFTVTVNTNAANNITITATLGNTSRTANLAVNAVPIVASFKVIPDPGSAATGEQCEAQGIPAPGGGTQNLMKCTFDAGSSTPQNGITNYIWRFFTPATGSTAFQRSNPTLSGISLPCGSFGSSGATFQRDVTLEVQTASGNATVSRMITFIRNGPCG
jgi:hypothetical protein